MTNTLPHVTSRILEPHFIQMDEIERQDFLSSRLRQPRSEAARFVETRVSIPGQPVPVYSERLDKFVTVEEATDQEHLRYINPCNAPGCQAS